MNLCGECRHSIKTDSGYCCTGWVAFIPINQDTSDCKDFEKLPVNGIKIDKIPKGKQ